MTPRIVERAAQPYVAVGGLVTMQAVGAVPTISRRSSAGSATAGSSRPAHRSSGTA